MDMFFRSHGDCLAFEAQTSPEPAELGRALEAGRPIRTALLHLHFGDEVARLPISDLWSSCCELLLQAELVREAKLDHFVVDVERVFDLSYDNDDRLLCIFSREHVFTVSGAAFADGLERLVREIFAGTSCPRIMQAGAAWGASSIRSQPYYYRFSQSVPA
jgi:hypothetical protein